MYGFSKHLFEGEKILYQARPVPNKGNKNIGVYLFLILFPLIINIITIFCFVNKIGVEDNELNIDAIAIFVGMGLIMAHGIYGIIYNCFLKKREILDDYYCITDLRVMKYESKKDKLVFGYIKDFDSIHVLNSKGGYGDLFIGVSNNEKIGIDEDPDFLLEYDEKYNIERVTHIMFESIEKPYKIKKIIVNQKKK